MRFMARPCSLFIEFFWGGEGGGKGGKEEREEGNEERVSVGFSSSRWGGGGGTSERSQKRKKNQKTDLGELLLVLLGDLRGLAADFTGTGERAVDFACRMKKGGKRLKERKKVRAKERREKKCDRSRAADDLGKGRFGGGGASPSS